MSMKLCVIGIVCMLGFSAEALAKNARSGKVRPKHLNGEAEVKGNTVNFEDTDVRGGTKNPMMSNIGVNKADKNYDFVKIRLRWHPEMVASAAQLD